MVPHNKELSASTEAEQRVESSGFDKSRSVVTSRSQSSGTQKNKHILVLCELGDKHKKHQTNYIGFTSPTYFVIVGRLCCLWAKGQGKYWLKKELMPPFSIHI